MKCKECKYVDPAVVADPYSVKCTITRELRDDEDECNCEFSRLLHDKQINTEENVIEAVNSLAELREHVKKGFKSVDVNYIYNALLDVVNEGIVSDKLNEVIKYLQEYV